MSNRPILHLPEKQNGEAKAVSNADDPEAEAGQKEVCRYCGVGNWRYLAVHERNCSKREIHGNVQRPTG